MKEISKSEVLQISLANAGLFSSYGAIIECTLLNMYEQKISIEYCYQKLINKYRDTITQI